MYKKHELFEQNILINHISFRQGTMGVSRPLHY